jgi:membrane protease YdiL (CAAX protease family)
MAGYLFTILVYVILKIVNGGMTSELLVREKEVMSVPMLILCILIVGLRSGFGEEIFFRGVVAAYLFEKMKFAKANILQALIFMLPHIVTFLKLPGLESGLLQ